MSKPCKYCESTEHTPFYCYKKPRTPIKARSKPLQATKASKTVSKPSKKTPTRKALKKPLMKKLDKLVKDYVKRRDDYTCQRCGKFVEGADCHASHVIPVSRSGYLQFEPKNMKVLCYHDHINWWHKHPVESGAWFTDKFPERWEYLENLHRQRLKPMTVEELQEKIDYYQSLL